MAGSECQTLDTSRQPPNCTQHAVARYQLFRNNQLVNKHQHTTGAQDQDGNLDLQPLQPFALKRPIRLTTERSIRLAAAARCHQPQS